MFFLNRPVFEKNISPVSTRSLNYLLDRIWVFSKGNIFIVGFIFAICLATLGLDIFITVKILQVPFVTEFGAEKGAIIAIFTSGAAGTSIGGQS
jgi:hypothetical protein